MKIPFLSFEAMNAELREEMISTFTQVYDASWYILGDRLKEFEKNYASFNGVEECIGTSNGMDALFLCLRALGIGPGDEVIVPSHTYIATWLAVSYTGATPVPVEPNEQTMNMDPRRIGDAISGKTRAIMPVHLYGQSCDMKSIMEIARENNLFVIEDNAQAQGADQDGRLTGSFGHMNGTSFYPGKNLGALGDAGAITTNDAALAHKVRILRNYGSKEKYHHEVQGYNMRLDEMQAAFLDLKLKRLPVWIEKRREIASWYQEELGAMPGLQLPVIASGCTHVYHLYVVRTRDRDGLLHHLQNQELGAMIHYPIAPHLQGAYATQRFLKPLPLAEKIANTCLSLPIYPGLSRQQVNEISSAIRNFLKHA